LDYRIPDAAAMWIQLGKQERSRSSWIGCRRSDLIFDWNAKTPPQLPESPGASTGCRWQLNWRQHGCGCYSQRHFFARLDQRLPHLSSGLQDECERHQTMRDAIAWSYGLLDEEENDCFDGSPFSLAGAPWKRRRSWAAATIAELQSWRTLNRWSTSI
jgi:hypothetical protein